MYGFSDMCVFGSNIDRYSFLSFVLYALVFLIRVVLVDFMIRFAARRVHFVVEYLCKSTRVYYFDSLRDTVMLCKQQNYKRKQTMAAKLGRTHEKMQLETEIWSSSVEVCK